MNWDLITDIILAAAIAVLGVFAFLGLYQWIIRGSLKKVDRSLLAMFPPLATMLFVYIFFDKVWIINVRPDGTGKPSFPSSHVMAVATIFLLVALALPRYIKSQKLRIALYAVMAILTLLVSIGRIAANKHWPIDVIFGLIFALAFAGLYYYIVKKRSKHEQHLHKNH